MKESDSVERFEKCELADPGGIFSRHIFYTNSGLTIFDCCIIDTTYKQQVKNII